MVRMGFYEKYLLPHLLNLAMKNKEAAAHRRRILPSARGRVLEVGIGSGLNLPFYSRDLHSVVGVDPSEGLLRMAREAAKGLPFPVEFVRRGAEELPFEDQSFDSVVTTWTLCTIPAASEALGEMRRVLRADGSLIFIEHGRSPDGRVGAWQDRITPVWKRCAGGCHLNRRIDAMIEAAGFDIARLETGYLIKGPRPFTYHFEGQARRG